MTNKKSKIPYILLIFFLVVVSVNVGYIVISRDSLPGVATKNSYNKGIKYNQTIAQKEAQEQLGWKVEMEMRQSGENSKDIHIKLLDRRGQNIEGAKINVKFFRPTYEGIDFEVEFIEQKNIYQQQVTFPALGQWDFGISVRKGEDSFFVKKRLVIHNLSE
ncbi:MAG: FixH family protein [Rickettsiales bacterium]|nr:FixH family protein [Rickettsiales bacterium]